MKVKIKEGDIVELNGKEHEAVMSGGELRLVSPPVNRGYEDIPVLDGETCGWRCWVKKLARSVMLTDVPNHKGFMGYVYGGGRDATVSRVLQWKAFSGGGFELIVPDAVRWAKEGGKG